MKMTSLPSVQACLCPGPIAHDENIGQKAWLFTINACAHDLIFRDILNGELNRLKFLSSEWRHCYSSHVPKAFTPDTEAIHPKWKRGHFDAGPRAHISSKQCVTPFHAATRLPSVRNTVKPINRLWPSIWPAKMVARLAKSKLHAVLELIGQQARPPVQVIAVDTPFRLPHDSVRQVARE
jgi:hypothetical protein